MKFKDCDLIGVPLRVTIGERALKEGNVEIKTAHPQRAGARCGKKKSWGGSWHMLSQLGAGEPTPGEEILERIASLKAPMASSGIDFCLIMQNADLFYFTGSVQKGVLVVPLEGEPLFFVAEERGPRPGGESLAGHRHESGQRDREAAQGRKGMFKGKGGMELDVVPVALFREVQGDHGLRGLRGHLGDIKELRIVKSPFEIEQVRRSGAICDRIFARAREDHQGRHEGDRHRRGAGRGRAGGSATRASCG